jgi:hypothetical protein
MYPRPASGYGTRAPHTSESRTGPCRNWAADGSCKFGQGCRFSHDATPQAPRSDGFGRGRGAGLQPAYSRSADGHEQRHSHHQQSQRSGDRGVCANWQRGTCKFGSGCKNVHDPAPPSYVPPRPGTFPFREDPLKTTVEMDAAAVAAGMDQKYNELLGKLRLPESPNLPGPPTEHPLSRHLPTYEKHAADECILAIDMGTTKSIDDAISVVHTGAEGEYIITVFTALVAGLFPMNESNPVYRHARHIARPFFTMPNRVWRPVDRSWSNAAKLTEGVASPALWVRLITARDPADPRKLIVTQHKLGLANVALDAFLTFDDASKILADRVQRSATTISANQRNAHKSLADPAVVRTVRAAFDACLGLSNSDPRQWGELLRGTVSLTLALNFETSYSDPSQSGDFIMSVVKKAADTAAVAHLGRGHPQLAAMLLHRVVRPSEEVVQEIRDMFSVPRSVASSFAALDDYIQAFTKGYFSLTNTLEALEEYFNFGWGRDVTKTDASSRAHFTQPLRYYDCLHNQGVLAAALRPDLVLEAPPANFDLRRLTELYEAKDRADRTPRDFLLEHGPEVTLLGSESYEVCLLHPAIVLPKPGKVLTTRGLGVLSIAAVKDSASYPPGSLVTVAIPLKTRKARLLNHNSDLPSAVRRRYQVDTAREY